MQRIYNILVSLLGESKQGGFERGCYQYQFNCPWCAEEKGGVDNKYNLEISFPLESITAGHAVALVTCLN